MLQSKDYTTHEHTVYSPLFSSGRLTRPAPLNHPNADSDTTTPRSAMRPPASTVLRRTVIRSPPPWRHTVTATTVVVVMSVLLLSTWWCLPIVDAGSLHYHRKHRRHHHGHHDHTMNNGHISQPPVALLPDLNYGSPAEPPALPQDMDVAPPPCSRLGKPCPLSHPPSEAAVRAPRSLPPPAKTPVFFPAKPPSPSPARAPTHSHAKPPSIYLAKPPALPPAEPPTLPRTKPPAISPEKAPFLPHPHGKRPALFGPAKPPILSPSPAQRPWLLGKPTAHAPTKSPAKPPSVSPAKPPGQSPAQPPRLSPAKPPAHAGAKPPPPLSHAIPPVAEKPPSFAPAKPPALPPARLSPFKPPPYHAIPPVAVKPPSFAPAKPPALPPAQPPRLSPFKPPAQAPAKPPALPPASSAANKNGSAPCSNVFDVRAFGASGNGSCADDTRAFRAAWKAACSAESATLLVPSDGLFTVTSTLFAGPCKPGLTFQIDGVLMPPDGPASWPVADSRRQWITFNKTDGMTLTGRGTIEGNGEEWWNLPCKPHRGPNGSTLPGPCDSPALVRFFASSNVTVQGLRMENSPQFHLKFDGCDGVHVDGILLSSPAFSPNTDGVHVENTRNVQIYNSRINNGDDCVSIGAGCSNVHIENVTCGHGHGISIGSLGVHNTRACVSNVTVRNARIVDSDNGLRIKTWQGGAGSVTEVEFAGVRMENVRSCIVIDQYYCLGSGCANQTSAVRIAGVAYQDIRGTYDPRARGGPIRFACSDSVACTDITMTDVELRPADGGSGVEAPLANPYCWNAYGLTATLTVPPVHCLQQGRPESLQDQLQDC